MTAKDRIEGDWQILIGDYGEPTEGKLNFADGVVEASGYWEGKGTYQLDGDDLRVELGRKTIEMSAVGDGFFSGQYSEQDIDVLVDIRRM